MKRIYAMTLAFAGAAMTMTAQSKFDLPAGLLVNQAESNRQAKAQSRAGTPAVTLAPDLDPSEPRLVIVTLNDTMNAADLSALGYDVENTDSKLVFARLTPAQMQELAKLEGVKQISLGYGAELKLNTARAVTGVDAIHSGSDDGLQGHSYTGKGVITGLMDLGMDINHINFLTSDNKPRTKRLWTIQGSSGVVTTYDTESQIQKYTTDDEGQTHATHVLGIMSGSFNGKPADRNSGRISYINEDGGLISTFNTRMPYYGVAKDAEPAVCIGTLDGNNVELAVEKVRAYAKEQGKPAVMNLSLGHNRGPHDGTDAESRKLAEYGKDILICMSAGNEGSNNISLRKKFTASDKSVKSTVSTSASAVGYIDIWGDNASILSITFVAVEKNTGNIKYQYKLDRNTKGASVYITGDAYNAAGYIHDPAFNDAFGQRGALIMTTNINTENNRYNFYAQFDLNGSTNSKIVPGFIIEGNAGDGVSAFVNSAGGSNVQFFSNNIPGYVNGSTDNTINGMACGDNVLVVGSYNNVKDVATLGGGFRYNFEKGDISPFSSVGTTFQGRQLPDVTGPGMGMIASYNKYYVSKTADESSMSAWINSPVTKNAKDYWGEMSGTSMSSPFVAGVLALWLEADPTLTIDRVKEIIKKTAVNDEFTAKNKERWGMGKINALAGLKEILGTGSLNTVQADVAAEKMSVEALGGKRYSVFVGGTDGFTANLYNMQGALTATVTTSGDTAEVDASQLSEGIYVLEVQGKNLRTSRKFMVK